MSGLKELLDNPRPAKEQKEDYCEKCDAMRPHDEDGCFICSYNKEKARVEAELAEKQWEWDRKSEEEKRALTQKKYRERNKEALKSYRKDYYQKNKDKKKQQAKEQYAKLKELAKRGEKNGTDDEMSE